MPTILLALAIIIVAAVAAAIWWRLTSPGKRLRIGTFTLYYTHSVTPDEANRVAQYLMQQNFSNQQMDARLIRQGAEYKLQLICTAQPVESQVVACEVLAAGLSDDVFTGAAVEIQVCDSIFRPFLAIAHRRRFGRRVAMNTAHLFYLDGVTDSDALTVATCLAKADVFDGAPKIAQMNRSADGYEFRLAVEVDPLAPEMVEGERRMASDLSKVLRGAPVAVHFGRGLLGTLRAEQMRVAENGTADS